MSKFYNDVHTKATQAFEQAEVERKTRAQTVPMVKATKDAITAAAAGGAFSCLVNGVAELDGTDTTRVEKRTFNTASGPEKLDVIDVGSDVLEAVAEQLAKLEFDITPYAVGIKRVSWQADKKQAPQG